MKIVRNLLAVSALAGGMAALPGAAVAAPNYLGPSGYILTPDAMVVPHLCVNGHGHWFDTGVFNQLFPDPDVVTAGGNIGLFDVIEAGATVFNVTGGDEFDEVWVNAKVSPLPPKSPFQIAGGVMDAADETARAGYVVGQFNIGPYRENRNRLLPRTARVGAGFGTGNVIDGVFVNGSVMVLPTLEIMGEWIKNVDEPSIFLLDEERVNAGARLHFKGLALDVAGIDLDDDAILAAGLSYTYCPGKKHKKKVEEKGKGEEEIKPEDVEQKVPAPVQKEPAPVQQEPAR